MTELHLTESVTPGQTINFHYKGVYQAGRKPQVSDQVTLARSPWDLHSEGSPLEPRSSPVPGWPHLYPGWSWKLSNCTSRDKRCGFSFLSFVLFMNFGFLIPNSGWLQWHFWKMLFTYSFSFGCAGSFFLPTGFLQLQQAGASHCSSFSHCGYSAARGIFPNQGSSLWPRYWQVDS